MGDALRLYDDLQTARSFRNKDVLHCVVTRFNLRIGWARTQTEMTASEREAWLTRRIELFQNYCLPSVLGQAILPDAWFVLLDSQVDRQIGKFLEELLDHPFIIPLLLKENWNRGFQQERQAVIRRRFGDRKINWVNSVRLDSDDCLNRTLMAASDLAMARLRSDWKTENRYCLNFPYAARYEEGVFKAVVTPHHFFTLVEPAGEPSLLYRLSHTRINEIADVTDVMTPAPMFLYHRHDFNDSQSMPRRSSAPFELSERDRLRHLFGLSDGLALLPE